MTWTTRSLNKDSEYIVLKHPLSGINGFLCGVKFHNGYGVTVRNSKAHKQLRMLPFLRDVKEQSILTLRKLPFITRTVDIQLIYGKDIYNYYLSQLDPVVEKEQKEAKVVEEVKHLEENFCSFRTKKGELCKHEAFKKSPSGYCRTHILLDPHLEEYGIKVPERMTYQERGEWKERVIKKLERVKLNR